MSTSGDSISRWSYSHLQDAFVRLPYLSKETTFADITRRIASEMVILCCHASEIGGTAFSRPVYTVQVPNEVFDLFFNSAHGYRAAYLRSPGAGIEANLEAMRALATLLAESALSTNSGMTRERIVESLTTPSSKLWLAEHGKEIDLKCLGCKGEWSASRAGPPETAEILNGVWESAKGQKAEWGRKAPYLTKLRLMGAFLNERLDELVPFDKRYRAYEINRFGWA